MLRRSLTLLLITALALNAGIASADVYKFKDEHGNVLYTDKPATLPAERLSVQSRKTDVVAVQARQQAEMTRMQSADGTREKGAADQADQQAAEQISAKDKAERCVKARARYESYMTSHRLYETQANGERRYLSDAELTAARNASKASMDELCK